MGSKQTRIQPTSEVNGMAVDEDVSKGVVEDDPSNPKSKTSQESMSGQLGHRDQNAMLKDNDTDFPEPDAEEEHTGEPGS
jgi:hypothetical protein